MPSSLHPLPVNPPTEETPLLRQCWRIEALLRDLAPAERALRAATRLLDLVLEMGPGESLTLLLAGDGAGRVDVNLIATTRTDLQDYIVWACADVAQWQTAGTQPALVPLPDPVVVELVPTATLPAQRRVITSVDDDAPAFPPASWPVGRLDDAQDLLSALTTTRAQVRVHLAPASPFESEVLADMSAGLHGAPTRDPGRTVRVRCFAGQAGGKIPTRLRVVLRRLATDIDFVDRDLTRRADLAAWEGGADSLAGFARPATMALAFLRVPAAGTHASMCGLPTAPPPTAVVPLSHQQPPTAGGLRIGAAVTTSGQRVPVTVAPQDLLRHLQVLGASGAGKSTLLAAVIGEAVRAGVGVSVLDPHGHLVRRVVSELPAAALDRTLMVLSGDQDNPVPINSIGAGALPMVSETMLTTLRELLDPHNQGFLGPRYERVHAQFQDAARILFAERACLPLIPMLIDDQKRIKELADAISPQAPDLARDLMNELGRMTPMEFADLSGWVKSKFQRLIGSATMRSILGTGRDALNVADVMESKGVLLVDLASPTLGTTSAQLLGEMWLTKHWAALGARTDPASPHLLIVDEAHLFASGLLPRLLTEGRKFGLGVILAHQHLEQLTSTLREAAAANTSSLISFRSGAREAAAALSRLGEWPGGDLTRLPNMHAAVTLSLTDIQSEPFTLHVDHNDRIAHDPTTSDRQFEYAVSRSNRLLVAPHRGFAPITHAELNTRLHELTSASDQPTSQMEDLIARYRRPIPSHSQPHGDPDET